MKWLPIVRVEDNIVFVKTLRGIEPVQRANTYCDNARAGKYALCKSIRNQLFMFEVEA